MRMVAGEERTWKIFVYLFLLLFVISKGQGIYHKTQCTRGERKKYMCPRILTFLKYIGIYQAWVVMFQKCPEKKKTPSLRPTQAPWPFAWKYSKYFWKKLHNFYNIRLSTCPRPSCFHSPSSMFSTKS